MALSKINEKYVPYDELSKWMCVSVDSKAAGNFSPSPPSYVSFLYSHLLSVHLLFDMFLQKIVNG